ncbi:hypothetical protein F4780DRAFT_771858 [Xylariomycetidae sp. FL0641]|nr:hypothetical protein F4780DRAFT_774087 [Xylariomycetidae sp. FL0641]KAI0018251.1 hypothetical protein F4780DRAFT_771858 [Xylariomycetidae sp. FL0641]
MHRAPATRWLNNALNITERPARFSLPLFLCPAAESVSYRRLLSTGAYASRHPVFPYSVPRRCLHMQADLSSTCIPAEERRLPHQCSGCGALSQTSEPTQPGYYDLNRKAVRKYVEGDQPTRISREEDRILEDALKNVDHQMLERQGVDVQALAASLPSAETHPAPVAKKPLCDRCHYLLHNHAGHSIFHPSIDSVRDTILESPYKYNHVYHVLDAADFPMSLLPGISQLLDLMPLRSKNRRARTGYYFHGQKTEVSFIITRADLLAPTKPQVDRLFPYLREVLRDALGRMGRDVRLGNLAAVSAKRSWWTKELKEDIWKRGGAGWMVGKANVGKSQLFEAVFPKGRMDWTPSPQQISVDMQARAEEDGSLPAPDDHASQGGDDRTEMELELTEDDTLDEFSLLPPAPPETQFPEMPLVSDLPGTTASPIRVPFGNGRGELIDLPGLERTRLEYHVKEEHRLDLIMRSRIKPEQMTLKPGQSLILGGGLIRITPREPAPIMLSYAFTPIEPHVTRTDKAIALQEQTGNINVDSIAMPGTGEKTKLAGSFKLQWDVTRQRAGPLTRKDAVGLKVDSLPFWVVSTDILIEGVGWVEMVAQVRSRELFAPKQESEESSKGEAKPQRELSALERLEALAGGPDKRRAEFDGGEMQERAEEEAEPNWPVVDVYSPEGKFVSSRKPMNGWLLNKPRVTAASRRSRPRKSMKGAKKREKKQRREREASAAAAPAP